MFARLNDSRQYTHTARLQAEQLTVRNDPAMAYDEALAARIRELGADKPGLTEQKPFGGLAFLIGGNMAIAASGQGGLLVRVDPEESDALVADSHARPFEMRGRLMRG